MDLLSSFFLCFAWTSIFVIAVYWYFTKNYSYWKKRGVPSVPTLPAFGSVHGLFSKLMQDTEVERYKKYGRIYGFYEGSRPLLSVGDPELLRNIFVRDFQVFPNRRKLQLGDPLSDKMLNVMEGDDWKRVRTIMSPAFTTGKLRRMVNIFKECAKTLSQNFTAIAKEGKPIDAKKWFGAFTMDVIASSAFSTKLDYNSDPNNCFVSEARKMFGRDVPWTVLVFSLFPTLKKLFRISVFSAVTVEFFQRFTLQIIRQRKISGQVSNDFLQLLMDIAEEVASREEETESSKTDRGKDTGGMCGAEGNTDELNPYIKKKSLTYDEMIAQCVIFFLAGYDTTTTTLSFLAYNLALNPDCQETLIQEIDEVVKETDGQITYEAVQGMKYLDNVISESLRLFPPVIRLERKAEEGYKLGDTGIIVPEGMNIRIPVYAMHRDPEFFPEPDRFDPQRFSAEVKSSRNPFTYLPFGYGPRNCIAMRFALLEVKVCFVVVLSQFRIKRCQETKIPPEYYRGCGLLQTKAVIFKM